MRLFQLLFLEDQDVEFDIVATRSLEHFLIAERIADPAVKHQEHHHVLECEGEIVRRSEFGRRHKSDLSRLVV